MKQFMMVFFLFLFLNASSQTNANIPPIDKSPMDMSYFPVNFPILKIQNKATTPPVMRVVYSRPHREGRKIFGELQPYGEVWRLGANEATEIEFFRDIKINNQKIKKGRYTLYAIPFPDKWTMIINKETDTWGSFGYNASKDILRMNLPVATSGPVENMTIVFEKNAKGAELTMSWEDAKVCMPIEF
ncbi:MAG: DUF2911 domain-containing protein [Ginsengibacter sp.]